MVEDGGAPLRVLLFSPVAGVDPASGDTSYTETLLAAPPAGVVYTTYREALADGSLLELGRRPRHGSASQPGIFVIRAVEVLLRRAGLMFREPVWWVRVQPGRFDVMHQHLFAVRQVGPRTPVVSSAGYPLTDHYRERSGWSGARAGLAGWWESIYARVAGVHVPWLRSAGGPALMTVYSETFRRWLLRRGEDPRSVSVVSTFLGPRELPPPQGRSGRRLAFVGRDFEAKGGGTAVAAFDLLRAADPAWTLVVVTTRAAATFLEPRDGMVVLVDQTRDDVQRVLDETDVLLAPTSSDCGVPYGLLEALRSGVCVVTSTLRWLDERLTGPGVRRVAVDPAEVAGAASEMAGNVGEREGARGLFERSFSAPDCLDDTLAAAYRSVARRRTGPPGILVVAPRREVQANPFDGFAVRHRRLVEALADRGRVVLGVIDDASPAGGELPSVDRVVELPAARPAAGRMHRLGRAVAVAAGVRPGDDLSVALAELVADSGCDVAVTVGPWIDSAYRPVWQRTTSLHLFEEDLSQVAALAPQSLQARALRRVEWALESLSGAQPERVVAISTPEVARARRRFPRRPVDYVPFGLDERAWPVFTTASEGSGVIVVGNFAEARNADGLVEVLDVVVARGVDLRFVVASGPGLHASLRTFLRSGLLRHESADDLVPFYRDAGVALVPARSVTGQKTTILQAWACGVPVVATDQAAATVGEPDALRTGRSADDLVDELIRITRDPMHGEGLVRAGLTAVARSHRAARERDSLMRVLRDVY